MEKYGTDLSAISPSDDQLREIKKLASDKQIPQSQIKQPKTYDEANAIIDHLTKYGKEE